MKENMKKVMKIAFALCMVAVLLFESAAEVQAASYAKSFTKTVNITGALLELKMNVKKDAAITVKVSTTSKEKNLTLQAKMWKEDMDMAIANLNSDNKSGKFKLKVKKGVNTLYIENFTGKNVKVKITVSTKDGKVIKYKSKQISDETGR